MSDPLRIGQPPVIEDGRRRRAPLLIAAVVVGVALLAAAAVGGVLAARHDASAKPSASLSAAPSPTPTTSSDLGSVDACRIAKQGYEQDQLRSTSFINDVVSAANRSADDHIRYFAQMLIDRQRLATAPNAAARYTIDLQTTAIEMQTYCVSSGY